MRILWGGALSDPCQEGERVLATGVYLGDVNISGKMVADAHTIGWSAEGCMQGFGEGRSLLEFFWRICDI